MVEFGGGEQMSDTARQSDVAMSRAVVLTLVGGVAHEAGQERADGARKGLGPERHQVPRQVALLLTIDG